MPARKKSTCISPRSGRRTTGKSPPKHSGGGCGKKHRGGSLKTVAGRVSRSAKKAARAVSRAARRLSPTRLIRPLNLRIMGRSKPKRNQRAGSPTGMPLRFYQGGGATIGMPSAGTYGFYNRQ